MQYILDEYPITVLVTILVLAYLYIAKRTKDARKVGENPISIWDWIRGKHLR
jgi:hypothetical protein